MDLHATRIAETLILPPGGPILLGLLGLMLVHHKSGKRLLLIAWTLLLLISLPAVSKLLMAGLESYPTLAQEQLDQLDAEAIVVLGGGRYYQAPEFGGQDSVNRRTLFRLRYAALLARKTGLPVIPSGGIPLILGKAEARINRDVLQDEFGVRVEHIEQQSLTTWENARYTAQLMNKLGIGKIVLVTDAAHMPRAVYAFQHNNIDPIPAPTGFASTPIEGENFWLKILPNANALLTSYTALHEYLGLLWYRLR
jgi:uncharacterized SAM-binding protein YcdF (DUF218 family)